MSPAQRWMGLVTSLGCVICRRQGLGYVPAQFHHIAEGSGKRSDFAGAPLCEVHHDPYKTGTGFHGMGTEKFCKLFRIPGETEYGLLVLVNEDMARQRIPS